MKTRARSKLSGVAKCGVNVVFNDLWYISVTGNRLEIVYGEGQVLTRLELDLDDFVSLYMVLDGKIICYR